jgi:nucleoside-diphosphate-sugar epimerase
MSDSAFEGRRIVVTGGSGFLATALIGRLMRVKCRILRVLRPQAQAAELPPGLAACDERRGDLGQREFCAGVVAGADYLFHFAAQTSVYVAEKDPAADRLANVEPMRQMLEACGDAGARPFILFAGSATQCGLPERKRINESVPDQPVTAYDRHKLEAESLLERAVSSGSARGTTLRLANIYGPGAARGSADRGVLNRMMQRALRGEALTLYGEGAELRDYLYIDDVVDAFFAAAVSAVKTDGRHFLLGSGDGRSLAEAFGLVANRAERLTGKKAAIVRVDAPAGLSPIETRSVAVDAARFRAATGWMPRVPFAEGIDRTLAALQAMPTEAA